MAYATNDLISICRTSTAELDPDSNAVSANLLDADDASLTNLPVFGALGITSRPCASDNSNSCESVVFDNQCIIAQRDTRCTKVYSSLKEGDTAIYSTDSAGTAKIILQGEDKSIKFVVGDTTFTLDEKNKSIQIANSENTFLLNATTIKLQGAAGIIQLDAAGITIGTPAANIAIAPTGITLTGAKISLGSAAAAQPAIIGVAAPGAPSTMVFTTA